MKVAVVGATGLVGTQMIQVLQERSFPVTMFIPVASEKSVGKKVTFKGKEYSVVGMQDAINMKPDLAIFSAGGTTSKTWAPKFAEAGTTVVDNSSAWRMEPGYKLVVALVGLHRAYKVKRIVVSTYQSVTGTGKKAVDQLMNERNGISGEMAYPHKIDMNALAHIDG